MMPNMDPEMMKIAMEQMRNMTPEQVQQMQEQVKNMSPETMQAAMNQMKNANPEDVKRQMRNTKLNPDDLKRNMDAFDAQTKAQSNYKYDASSKLKAEGNAFFSSGKYAEASEKYLRAIDNLVTLTNQEAKKLLQTCYLNNAACCLHLQKYDECIKHCSQVMKTKSLNTESGNFKCLYRRGQAYLHTSKYKEAVADLKGALALNPKDESLAEMLKKAEESLKEYEMTKPTVEDLPIGETQEEEVVEGVVEEVMEKDADAATAAAVDPPKPKEAAAGAPATSSSSMAAQAEKMKEMMETDPTFKTKMMDQMRNMSDEELMAALEASGQNTMGMTPEMLKMAKNQFASMSDDQLMMAMNMKSQAKTSEPVSGMSESEMMDSMAKTMQENPGLMKQGMEMMGNMSEEEIEQMAKMAGSMPGAQEIDAAQMKQAVKAMKDMKPEELENLTKLVQETQGDPRKLEKLQKGAEALGSMSTDTVKSVASSMGYEMSEGQAAMMTKLVRAFSMILKFVVALKNFIVSKWFFALAVLIVLLSLYMRQ